MLKIYVISLIFAIYLCWGSNYWLAILIKNHWFIFIIVHYLFFVCINQIKRKILEKQARRRRLKEQAVHQEKIQKRFDELVDKYGDIGIAGSILNNKFWQGQTKEQLIDSLGYPEKTENKLLKTKKKEIWRYKKISARSYGLSIILENDIVVGWDKK